jgi:serine protease Do
MQLKQCFPLAILAAASVAAAAPDTILLKDKASLTGKILAEKRDQVALDIGYTVLVIPRNQIAKISRTGFPETAPETNTPPQKVPAEPAKAATPESSALYASNNKPGANRTVNELVDTLGESVVQIRTPAGLGSGFMINEEGY